MPGYRQRLSAPRKRVAKALENPARYLLTDARAKGPEITETFKQAINAMVQRDNLQQMAEDWKQEIQRLEKEIEVAESVKDEGLAKRLQSQKTDYEDLLTVTRELLSEALQEVDNVKVHLQKERETHQRLMESRRFFPWYW
ncbi:MAG: hypothetical protein QM758_03570 [Armatimonas sp.]